MYVKVDELGCHAVFSIEATRAPEGGTEPSSPYYTQRGPGATWPANQV